MRRMLPPRRGGAQTRGQSLVEFALVLPVLLLIVLIGLDFGRSFLAWVGLNNAARIAANYASLHPDSWGTPGNATYKAEYAKLVTNDFQNAGCTAPTQIPTPVFLDGGSTALLSQVSVSLPCHLPLVTPLIGGFFPSGVPITGGAVFAVRGGILAGTGGGGAAPSAAFTASYSPDPCPAECVVTITNSTSGTVTNWYWDFGDGTVSIAQNPGTHSYTAAGTYTITMNATNTYGTSQAVPATINVTVVTLAAAFTWAPTSPTSGQLVSFAGTATGGSPGYTWSWVFGDGATATTQNPTHTYATAGTFTVTLTVKDSVNATTPVSQVITVSAPTCPVPNLVSTETTGAQKAWRDAGFATNVNFVPGVPPKFLIGQQITSPVSSPGDRRPCDTTQIQVTK